MIPVAPWQGWKWKVGSQTVRVLQQGPGPLRPQLAPDWLENLVSSFSLAGPRVLSPATTGAAPASRTKVRNVATWDPPGLVSLRSFQISRETCLPVGWRHHHTFKWMPRTAFCWLVGFRKRVFNLNIWNIHRCLNVKRKQPAWPEKMFNNNFAKFPTASCDCCQSTLVRRSLATQKWNCNLLACL